MRINNLTDYAMVILCFVATEDRLLSAREIATGTKLAVPTVTKLLKLLTKAQLLKSTLGASGGYQLDRRAMDISLLDVMEAIDGPLSIIRCLENDTHCQVVSSCQIRQHWHFIQFMLVTLLQSLSLEHFTKKDKTSLVDALAEIINRIKKTQPQLKQVVNK